LTAFGYRDGPFQIDMVRSDRDGKAYFLEMGYGLSGVGLVRLVEQLTGQDWAALAFDWALAREWPDRLPSPRHAGVGQCLLRGQAALARATSVRFTGTTIEIECSASRGEAPPTAADALRTSGFAGRARIIGPSVDVVRAVVASILGREGSRARAG
jgi:hypothetical protein